MNRQKLLSLIDEMIYYDWYNCPKDYYSIKKSVFTLNSYRSWALNEIRMYALNNTKDDSVSCIENFRNKINDFACEALTPDANFMYSVAYDVATEVLDMLLVE